jgi:small subunit ribosomal protein S20
MVMPNYKNAEKALRVAEKRRIVNKRNLSTMRTYIKNLRKAIENGEDKEDVKKMLIKTVSIIDKTVKKGAIKDNTASRYKSRLSKQVNNYIHQEN